MVSVCGTYDSYTGVGLHGQCLDLFGSFDVVYSVTPKPGRWDFVNIEKIHNKYQLLMVRFIQVIHPPRYGEI